MANSREIHRRKSAGMAIAHKIFVVFLASQLFAPALCRVTCGKGFTPSDKVNVSAIPPNCNFVLDKCNRQTCPPPKGCIYAKISRGLKACVCCHPPGPPAAS